MTTCIWTGGGGCLASPQCTYHLIKTVLLNNRREREGQREEEHHHRCTHLDSQWTSRPLGYPCCLLPEGATRGRASEAPAAAAALASRARHWGADITAELHI